MPDARPALRLEKSAFGALAGLGLWLLADRLDWYETAPKLWLVLVVWLGLFAAGSMLLSGRVPRSRALPVAAALALLPALLAVWASSRFETVPDFLRLTPAIPVLFALGALQLPFALRYLSGGTFARATGQLIASAGTALGFTLIGWAILLLSDALLTLVGITVLGDLIRHDAVRFALTGALLGLGLAVILEAGDVTAAPALNRLLRALLPFVLAVILLFLIGLPMRGLSGLFGTLSAAGTLLGMAGLASALVLAVADRVTPPPRLSSLMARAMAATVPVLALLAAVALWMRVRDYGLTPPRVAAAACIWVGLVAGAAMLWAALSPDWARRVHRAAMVVAASVWAVAALWLTPALNPEALSARSQEARLASGRLALKDAPLWEMAHSWGRPGRAALARIAEMPEARARVAAAEQADGPWDLAQTFSPDGADVIGLEALPESFRTAMPEEARSYLSACRAAGDRACHAEMLELVPELPGKEVVLWVAGRDYGPDVQVWTLSPPVPRQLSTARASWAPPATPPTGVEPGSRVLPVVRLGETEIYILPENSSQLAGP